MTSTQWQIDVYRSHVVEESTEAESGKTAIRVDGHTAAMPLGRSSQIPFVVSALTMRCLRRSDS